MDAIWTQQVKQEHAAGNHRGPGSKDPGLESWDGSLFSILCRACRNRVAADEAVKLAAAVSGEHAVQGVQPPRSDTTILRGAALGTCASAQLSTAG